MINEPNERPSSCHFSVLLLMGAVSGCGFGAVWRLLSLFICYPDRFRPVCVGDGDGVGVGRAKLESLVVCWFGWCFFFLAATGVRINDGMITDRIRNGDWI